MQPETRYARSGDVHIAYQVVGEGPRDLVLVPGWMSHVENQWRDRLCAAFLMRLASFSRLILFDKRGTGMSDPVSGAPPLEQRMDDVSAVMDAAGSEQAALLGYSEGASMSVLFSATYPERTSGLILLGAVAHGVADADHPWGIPDWFWETSDDVREHWGEGRSLWLFAPRLATDESYLRRWGAVERAAMSPGMLESAATFIRAIDIGDVLPTVRVPTLVLHRRGDPIPVAGGRHLASSIPGARLVELAGDDHLPWLGDSDAVLGEIEQFLTGARRAPEPDRVLATIVFTDVVGSTEQVSRLGDRQWRALLDDHDELVREQIQAFRGEEINTTGDGFLARFDGPARGIRCAQAIATSTASLGLRVRAGVHTGECEVRDGDLGGIAVHIGARVAGAAGAGEVLVSSTVRDLVAGAGLTFEHRGSHAFKGVPGELDVYRLVGA